MSTVTHFEAELAQDAREVELRLHEHLAARPAPAPRLSQAMRYALLAGGKRLRPLLCLWTCDALGAPRGPAAWASALALEMLHSYSLVHDDLPAMDDDDLRRGQPSCHRRFDEATAILAGDALQSEAFWLLANQTPQTLATALLRELAEAAGASGMAAGQQLDLAAAAAGAGEVAQLERMHRLKTGRLLAASLAMGGLSSNASAADVDRLRAAGETAGLAFQIVDDVLDSTRSAAQLGKSPGKDARQRKLTALTVYGGAAAASQRARSLLEELTAALPERIAKQAPLVQLLHHLATRTH
jgi:geranylgeranyl pyrophosphate synthase